MTAEHVLNTPSVTEHMMYLAKMDTTDMANHTMIQMILVVQNVPTIHIVLQDTNVKTDSVFPVQQMARQHAQHVPILKHNTLMGLNVYAVLRHPIVTGMENVQTIPV